MPGGPEDLQKQEHIDATPSLFSLSTHTLHYTAPELTCHFAGANIFGLLTSKCKYGQYRLD